MNHINPFVLKLYGSNEFYFALKTYKRNYMKTQK